MSNSASASLLPTTTLAQTPLRLFHHFSHISITALAFQASFTACLIFAAIVATNSHDTIIQKYFWGTVVLSFATANLRTSDFADSAEKLCLLDSQKISNLRTSLDNIGWSMLLGAAVLITAFSLLLSQWNYFAEHNTIDAKTAWTSALATLVLPILAGLGQLNLTLRIGSTSQEPEDNISILRCGKSC